MEGLTEGRIVHYVMSDGRDRPAIVVSVMDKTSGLVEVQVFLSKNDYPYEDGKTMTAYASYHADASLLGSWHWIENA
jgi:hypothetical protein